MSDLDISRLIEVITARAEGRARVLVGIVGAPGSGKSTLAADLAHRLGPTAATLPMDGFHLDNARLRDLGVLDRKGAPETFDADGFASLLRKVQSQATVSFPTFDRDADASIPDAGRIEPHTRFVLVEGNYLLLKAAPWTDLAGLFDLTVGLNVDRGVLEERLIKRWLDQGLSASQARARALGNDMRNADHVIDNSHPAEITMWTQA